MGIKQYQTAGQANVDKSGYEKSLGLTQILNGNLGNKKIELKHPPIPSNTTTYPA